MSFIAKSAKMTCPAPFMKNLVQFMNQSQLKTSPSKSKIQSIWVRITISSSTHLSTIYWNLTILLSSSLWISSKMSHHHKQQAWSKLSIKHKYFFSRTSNSQANRSLLKLSWNLLVILAKLNLKGGVKWSKTMPGLLFLCSVELPRKLASINEKLQILAFKTIICNKTRSKSVEIMRLCKKKS